MNVLSKVLPCRLLVSLVAVLIVGALVGVSIATASTTGTITAVPFGASGYQYNQVSWGAEAGFEEPSYDASSWSTGQAAFGTTYPCLFNANGSVKTNWDVNTDLLVRKEFSLPAGAHNVRVQGTVDNDATVYLNGEPIGTVASGFCASPNIDITAPNSAVVAGTNLLAIRGHDYGGGTYLDVTVTYVLLPSTKDECKNGGWQTYGVFKNQGDCVSFVATQGKNPPSN